jgi:thioredoxin reductase
VPLLINPGSQNSHFYWNLASIRAVLPGIIKDDQIFHPIEPGFAHYPKENFEFVLGSANGVDPTKKTTKISTAQGEKTVPYDYLVLATGARAANDTMPWKAAGTHEEILALLHKTQEKVKNAKHVVIAGTGPTGVETSAEIRYECKDKEVVLLSADDELLGGDSIASAAEAEITKLGVQVRKNARVTGSKTLPDGKTEVTLANGEKIVTDLYMPTMGLTPNTEFLPSSFLNERKCVEVDELFQVKGVENIWACGDVVSKPRAGFMITDKQVSRAGHWAWTLDSRPHPKLQPNGSKGSCGLTEDDTGRRRRQECRAGSQGPESASRQGLTLRHVCLRSGPRQGSRPSRILSCSFHSCVAGQGPLFGHGLGSQVRKRYAVVIEGSDAFERCLVGASGGDYYLLSSVVKMYLVMGWHMGNGSGYM